MFSMKDQSFGQPNEAARGATPAVAKVARVLDVVAASTDPPGVSEIARMTGLSKSSVHGLVTALTQEGLLAPVTSGRGYRLGARLANFSAGARDQRLLDAALPHLDDLADTAGETALFGSLAGDVVRVLAVEESTRPLNLSAPVGSSVPVMAGALGKAYLASLPAVAAATYLASRPPRRYTDRSVTELDAYLTDVRLAGERGYALDRGEYLPGIAAAASSFAWSGGTYFVWIVGIEAEHQDGDLVRIGEAVREAATDIARELARDGEKMSRSA